jgi:hypothetical protein
MRFAVKSAICKPPQEQGLKIPPAIGDQVDYDFFAGDFVNHTVRLEEYLSDFFFHPRRQFPGMSAAMKE